MRVGVWGLESGVEERVHVAGGYVRSELDELLDHFHLKPTATVCPKSATVCPKSTTVCPKPASPQPGMDGRMEGGRGEERARGEGTALHPDIVTLMSGACRFHMWTLPLLSGIDRNPLWS